MMESIWDFKSPSMESIESWSHMLLTNSFLWHVMQTQDVAGASVISITIISITSYIILPQSTVKPVPDILIL